MKRFLAAALALFVTGSPSNAFSLDDIMDLTIRTGWRETYGTHVAGVDIKLSDGWKTYWRQPGDTGIPPLFDWSLSSNLSSSQVIWPAPVVQWTDGMRSIGYSNQVVFPMIVTPDNSGPVNLAGTIQIGVCKEICIPVQIQIKAILPAKGAFDQVIANAMDAQVAPGAGHVTCSFRPTSDSMAMKLTLPKSGQTPPDVVVEVSEPGMWIAEPKVTDAGDHWQAKTEILATKGTPPSITRSGVVITMFSAGTAYEYRGCAAE